MSQDAWDIVTNERAKARRGDGGLVDALVDAVQGALSTGRHMGTECINLEHFALQHGYYWKLDTTLPLPRELPFGGRGDCHANATKIATDHEDILYVEGFAFSSVVPIRHAWNQLPGGEAIDTTFAGLEHVGVAEYFGVPFLTEHVLVKSIKERAFVSLIDDWQAGWPLLSASAEELADIIWTPASA